VLVVEDHDFQRRTALMLLRKLGIDTLTEATNGVTALAVLAASPPPDVIVCDIDMPGMDGVEFITHVAERDLAGAVIIASALDAKVIDAVRAVGEGYGLQILGVLEKPLTARRLGELLGNYRPNPWSRSPTAHAMEGGVSITGAEVRSALGDGRIRLHLRPGVDVATGRVTTADIVPTWLDPGGGSVSPEVFVPALAREGLLAELSRRSLEAACADVGCFAATGLDLRISVALAPDSLHMPELAVEAGDVARAGGVNPARITFALDERALRAAPGAALSLLTRLRVKGFGIALANFGTGNASIEQLRAVPFTEIALAPALVNAADVDPHRVRTLDDTVQLARELGVAIIGSGCESEDDLRLLLEVGCDRITGGFIADAMAADELPEWLALWNPDRLGVGGPG
jgi:EAL domain-containing protein (putative c-di-GMP-specific phosphodiesterase class I)